MSHRIRGSLRRCQRVFTSYGSSSPCVLPSSASLPRAQVEKPADRPLPGRTGKQVVYTTNRTNVPGHRQQICCSGFLYAGVKLKRKHPAEPYCLTDRHGHHLTMPVPEKLLPRLTSRVNRFVRRDFPSYEDRLTRVTTTTRNYDEDFDEDFDEARESFVRLGRKIKLLFYRSISTIGTESGWLRGVFCELAFAFLVVWLAGSWSNRLERKRSTCAEKRSAGEKKRAARTCVTTSVTLIARRCNTRLARF